MAIDTKKLEELKNIGLYYRVFNNGQHIQVRNSNKGGIFFDWWPSSKKLIYCQQWDKPKICESVDDFIKFIRNSYARIG